MTAQVLDRSLTCYRIGNPVGAFPIFDDTGSRLFPGRWNRARSPMIVTSENFSTALLEKLVHGSGRLPPNQHFVTATIPPGISYEVFDPAAHPGWDSRSGTTSRAYGDDWQVSKRSLLLIVPSVVARLEHNFLINREHPEFPQIAVSLHMPVFWGRRLFP